MPAPPAPAAVAPQSDWLQEWQARTPLATRWALYTVIPISIVGMIITSVGSALSLTPAALTGGQVWRLFTSLAYQGGVLAFIFVVAALAMKAPKLETDLGTLRFVARHGSWGLLINIAWAGISVSAQAIQQQLLPSARTLPHCTLG